MPQPWTTCRLCDQLAIAAEWALLYLHPLEGNIPLNTDSGPAQLRERLYAAYVSTHEGPADAASAAHVFCRDILPHLPSDRMADILDIGCGQGQLVRQLVLHGFKRARGVDISPESVQAAHDAGIPQVFHADYMEALQGAALDVVIGTDFFEHLTKLEALEAVDRIRAASIGGQGPRSLRSIGR